MMKFLYFSMILILIVTVSYLLVQFPPALSDSGFSTGFEAHSPDLSNMSLVLYDTFQQTSPNSTKDLYLEFFDEKNKTLIKNVSFFINATKDDNNLMHELFFTHTGSVTLEFSPGKEMGKWVVNGTTEPELGGMMSDNDVLPIEMSAFTPGTYHIHLEVLALVYANGIVDQSHPPTFDSWWSVDDKGNISKYENSTTVSNETLSHVIKNVSPLQQIKSGATASDIVCKNGSYLAMTSYNQELVCLKAGTISKLASRGFLYGTSVENTNYTTVIISPESENPASHNSYSPDVVTVVLGVNNTMQWVNQADVANEIVPDEPLTQNEKSFGSDGIIKPDQSYTFTFTEPGTFTYHTEPHPWMKGTVIVLPYESSNFTPFAAKTYNLKQVHYYDSSNLIPKVSLYDYSYDGIEKDGLVSIGNQTFYQTTLNNDIYKLKGASKQFHNVTFSFPEGTLTTPGGSFVNLDVKFRDGFEEIYGGTTSSPDGSGSVGGISIPTQYGPHLSVNSISVLGNHTMPQAGITIYHDKVKLLVSDDNQSSPTVPQCVSDIQNQYAVAGPRGDTLCPIVNFQASGKIVNYTGFYDVYEYPEYLGTPNFVLEPGHNGTLSYKIDIGSIYNWGNEPPANDVNITNDIEFMHDAGMNDHPGVITSVDSKSEIIQKNGSALVTVTFDVSKYARPGTYWVHLPPGFCAGGETIILTITNCEK